MQALLIFIVETLRFKAGAVVKVHKLSAVRRTILVEPPLTHSCLSQLVGSIKTLRSKIFDITRSIAAEVQIVEDIPSSLTDACVLEAVPEVLLKSHSPSSILTVIQIDRDFVSVVVKKVSDDRKKVVEGFGKGMARVCTLYSK
jgi:N-terminal acetyltransferase B complex non-catalytic subunit